MALGLLQKGEILAFDSFVICVVFCHGQCLLFQVTVYGGLITLTYTSQCLRKRDVHFSLNLPQLGYADAPVDDRIAVGANRCQVSKLRGDGLIIRHVQRRKFRTAASDAVDLTGWTRFFVFRPASLKE